MINYIWSILIIVSLIYISFTGNNININDIVIITCKRTLKIIINLLPLTCMWLGLINIAKDSGLINIITKKVSKLLRYIFPDIPLNNNSYIYIASNMIMNVLGLGNAATPFGLKAINELNILNNNKKVISRSMITFLLINITSITIFPSTIISLRIMYKSKKDIIFLCFIISLLTFIIGIILDKIFYYIYKERDNT